MKKVILATDNENILKIIKFRDLNLKDLSMKKIHYREGILEILKKDKNIDYIILNEKIPGEISIEELIKKIKLINKKINIIYLYEKIDINKEKKLKELKINNIYNIRKIKKYKKNNLFKKNKNIKDNKNNIINKKIVKIIIEFFKNKKIIYNKYKKTEKNKIIFLLGKNNLEKTNLIYLIILYLINKNNKILLITINKNLINKKINNKTKILENLDQIILNKYEKNLIKYNDKYNYFLINIDYLNNKINEKLIDKNIKIIYVTNDNYLEIKKFKKDIWNIKKNIKNKNIYLNIILVKNNFFSISKLLIRNFYEGFEKNNIFYLKNSKINLEEKILKKEEIKIKLKNKKILEKILK